VKLVCNEETILLKTSKETKYLSLSPARASRLGFQTNCKILGIYAIYYTYNIISDFKI
jgi:hypothetical protein